MHIYKIVAEDRHYNHSFADWLTFIKKLSSVVKVELQSKSASSYSLGTKELTEIYY